MEPEVEARVQRLYHALSAMTGPAPAPAPPAAAEHRAEVVRQSVHEGLLGRSVAARSLAFIGEGAGADVAIALMEALLAELEEPTAVERMLAEHAMMIHAQTLNTYRRLGTGSPGDLEDLERTINIAVRLQAEFRRTLAAMRAWRSPPSSIVVNGQANLAHQQVIQQTNEVGSNGA